jgi:transposase-like protein
MNCQRCQSEHIIKNGFNRLRKQMYRCKECGYQFVLNPSKTAISDETKNLVDKLLLERNSLKGIQRVVGVSASWLQNYVNNKYATTRREVEVKKNSW